MLAFLLPLSNPEQKGAVNIWLALCLYLIGIAHWVAFMPVPSTPLLAIDDWRFAHYYYSVWQQALVQGVFPYEVTPALQPTTFFWAIPEMITSPQLFLLSILDLRQFALANILFQYSLGFVGACYWLKQMRCLAIAGIIFWLLFNFNGFIVAHIAVGHFWVGGYYLLPFFAAFVYQILHTATEQRKVTFYLIWAMVAIFLQGSFHIYIWCAYFLLFIALFNPFVRRSMAQVLVWSALLLSFRCLPAVVAFYGQTRFHFVGGFPTLSHLWAALTQIKQFSDAPISTYFGHIGSWELDMYIDISGSIFLLLFALYFSLPRYASYQQATDRYIYAPLLLLFSLSISYTYGIIAKLPIPLLHSERVSSRFFSVVLVFLIGMATARCQRFVAQLAEQQKIWATGMLLVFALLLGLSLWHHSLVWRIDNIAPFCPTSNLVTYQIISPANNLYKNAAWVGMACSILACLWLLISSFKNKIFSTKK
jgi:hypothetical protein